MIPMVRLDSEVNFDGFTLVIPSVAVGNVAQLAVDLLVMSLDLERQTSVWHAAIEPAAGLDPFRDSQEVVHTACELFASSEHKLAALQIRSYIHKELSADFFKKLHQLILQLKFKSVVVLTSCHKHEKHHVDSSQFRYISSDEELSRAMQACLVPVFQQLDNGKYPVYGGGYAIKLYEQINKDVKSGVLIMYCYEGDNRADAACMLELLCKILSINFDSSLIKIPSSWEFVFGNPPPVELY